MRAAAGSRKTVPFWVTLVLLAALLGVIVWASYTRLFSGPGGVDVADLDPRNPENVRLFQQLDAHYRAHPEARPRNWPPEQFHPESIARAREESRRAFAEASRGRKRVIQDYLRHQRQRGGG